MDVSQALKDAENALRDFIAQTLSSALGSDWVQKCGVSEERLRHWHERKAAEDARQRSGVVEERLIYYADFYDLKTVLKKHWAGEFSTAFGDWRTMEVFLSELEKLRNPDAHRRELLPHQKHLVLGISGELRSRIVRYRSKQETEEDYFPRIESARDSLGNIWVPEEHSAKVVFTSDRLRPGDIVDYVATATDPQGEKLEYSYSVGLIGTPEEWQESNEFVVRISEEHVASKFDVSIYVRSKRRFHARGDWDDKVSFSYCVLPPVDLGRGASV